MKFFKRIVYFLVILSVVLLSISFAIQNSTEVVFNYYIGSITSSLSVMIVVSFVSGVVLAFMSGGLLVIKLRLKSTHYQKKLQNLEQKYQKELSKFDKSSGNPQPENNHQSNDPEPITAINKNTDSQMSDKALN